MFDSAINHKSYYDISDRRRSIFTYVQRGSTMFITALQVCVIGAQLLTIDACSERTVDYISRKLWTHKQLIDLSRVSSSARR